MSAISIKRYLKPTDGVFFFEADFEILIFVATKAFVIHTNFNKLVLAKHNAAGYGPLRAINTFQPFLVIAGQPIVACYSI